MKKLVHGGDVYSPLLKDKRIIDFSANINPLGIPKRVLEATKKSIDDCINYPDPLSRKLISSLAESENVPESYITCGNGAADLIFRLVFSLKPKKSMVLAPTFAEYEEALTLADCEVLRHRLYEVSDFKLTNKIIEDIDSSLDILFLCNPNNPTGKTIERSLMIDIAKACDKNNVILVIDECFLEFVDDYESLSMIHFLGKFENIIILKAFTKLYAIPGLRLGYLLTANTNINEGVANIAQPWSVSVPASAAGVAALKEKEYVIESLKLIKEEKKRLIGALEEKGFRTFNPMANYILFKIEDNTGEKARRFREAMKNEGILIRSCENYSGLTSEFSRIAVKSTKDNLEFIEKLNSVNL